MPNSVHYLVDHILLEHGEYTPLEFLMRAGCLPADACEAWRNGDLEYLAASLTESPKIVEQRLRQAQNYMEQRGWQAHAVRHLAKMQEPPRPLRFSENSALDHFFHQHYRKPIEDPQLDLFTDSPVNTLANGVFWALVRCDAAEAQRLCARLNLVAPTHRQLGVFNQLVEAVEKLPTPVTDVAAELFHLQTSLLPLVQSTLGKEGRRLSTACWQRLVDALEGRPFDAVRPEVHRTFAAAQIGDWAAVRSSVESERGWQSEPVLLVRHAHACEQLQLRQDALQSWFQLFWSFPEHVDCVETLANTMLREKWHRFQELDPDLPVKTFPAWLVAVTPGLFRTLLAPGVGGSNCPPSYAAMLALQNCADQNDREQKIQLRSSLKKQDPILFEHYLAELCH